MIILKEECPPFVVQKVRLIKLYIKKKTMKKDLFIMIYTQGRSQEFLFGGVATLIYLSRQPHTHT